MEPDPTGGKGKDSMSNIETALDDSHPRAPRTREVPAEERLAAAREQQAALLALLAQVYVKLERANDCRQQIVAEYEECLQTLQIIIGDSAGPLGARQSKLKLATTILILDAIDTMGEHGIHQLHTFLLMFQSRGEAELLLKNERGTKKVEASIYAPLPGESGRGESAREHRRSSG